ncbi:MAG: hypothetical protein WEA09_11905 [Gemmatimonadota bacterium]
MRQKPPANRRSTTIPAHSLSFSRVNVLLGLAGGVSVAAGYVFLANGSITAAPLLLVLGYVVLLPMAIIK